MGPGLWSVAARQCYAVPYHGLGYCATHGSQHLLLKARQPAAVQIRSGNSYSGHRCILSWPQSYHSSRVTHLACRAQSTQASDGMKLLAVFPEGGKAAEDPRCAPGGSKCISSSPMSQSKPWLCRILFRDQTATSLLQEIRFPHIRQYGHRYVNCVENGLGLRELMKGKGEVIITADKDGSDSGAHFELGEGDQNQGDRPRTVS